MLSESTKQAIQLQSFNGLFQQFTFKIEINDGTRSSDIVRRAQDLKNITEGLLSQ